MNPKHHTFVIEYLKSGDKQYAYQQAYPNSEDRSALVSADRLLQREDIKSAIGAVQMQARYEAEQELKEVLKHTLLSTQEKRAILAQIARGDLYVDMPCKDCDYSETVSRAATQRERILAIKLDCEIESGKYDAELLNSRIAQLANATKNNKAVF